MERFLTLFLFSAVVLLGFVSQAQSTNDPTAVKLSEAARAEGMGDSPAQASTIWKPGFRHYRAKVHVAGGVTIKSTEDTLTTCSPGQAWFLTETADVEINGRMMLAFPSDGKPPIIATPIKTRKGVVQKSRISGYSETNFCVGPKADLQKPKCSPRLVGAGMVQLRPSILAGKQVVFEVNRIGGGTQDSSCLTTQMTDFPNYVSAFQIANGPGFEFATRHSVRAFKKLKVGKKLIFRVRVKGPCRNVRVTRLSTRTQSTDQTCRVTNGTFNIVFKRLRNG